MVVLIIADSRGRGIQQLIENEEIGEEVHMTAIGGAGSEVAAIRAIPLITSCQPKVIILMTGICDLTWRDKHTKVTKLRHKVVKDCVGGVMRQFEAACEILDDMGRYKVSVATMTGLDLIDYNYKPRAQMGREAYNIYCQKNKGIHHDQQILNEAVIDINRKITEFNRLRGVPTTWLSTVVHSYYRGQHHHKYNKLRDGCHPDEETKRKWGKLLAKSIKNIQKEK